MVRESATAKARREAKALRKNLTAKVSRIEKTGAKLAGTPLDPRKSAADIDNMTAAQAKAYSRKAAAFLDRSVGYVGGHRGVPIPIQDWRKYKAAERKNNKLARAEVKKYANEIVPGTSMTVSERDNQVRSDRPGANHDASRRPLEVVNRLSRGITSVKALDKLRKDLESKARPDFKAKAIRKTRKTMNRALNRIGDKVLAKKLRKLEDEELNFLWNYGGLAESLFSRYPRSSGSDDPGFEAAEKDADDEINEFIEWADEASKKRKELEKRSADATRAGSEESAGVVQSEIADKSSDVRG